MPDLLDQLREYGSLLDESALDLDWLEARSGEAMVVDFDDARRDQPGDRRWLVVAAALVLAVVVVAGTVLATRSGDHHVGTGRPVDGTPTTTPPPPPPTLYKSVVPAQGATPSTPETGERVAGLSFDDRVPVTHPSGIHSMTVYADGRVIRLAYDAPNGMGERRLNAEGVEAVRSFFVATGLFAADQTNSDAFSLCGCTAQARDDSGNLVVPPVRDSPLSDAERAAVDPRVTGEIDRIVEFMTHLESSLPANAWADPHEKPYVPSRYQFHVWYDDGFKNVAVPDRSNALARLLLPRLVRRLDAQGWLHDWSDVTVVTLATARKIDRALGGYRFQHWDGSTVYRADFSLSLTPFMPDALP